MVSTLIKSYKFPPPNPALPLTSHSLTTDGSTKAAGYPYCSSHHQHLLFSLPLQRREQARALTYTEVRDIYLHSVEAELHTLPLPSI